MKYFVGLDVSVKETSICIVDETGKICSEVLTRSVKCSWLKAWAMNIAKNRGLKRAIVALARRVAVIMHRIWVDGTEFRWTNEKVAST